MYIFWLLIWIWLKMDKIKINFFVLVYYGKYVDFNKGGFLVRVFFYLWKIKKMVVCKFSWSIKIKNYDKIDFFLF